MLFFNCFFHFFLLQLSSKFYYCWLLFVTILFLIITLLFSDSFLFDVKIKARILVTLRFIFELNSITVILCENNININNNRIIIIYNLYTSSKFHMSSNFKLGNNIFRQKLSYFTFLILILIPTCKLNM